MIFNQMYGNVDIPTAILYTSGDMVFQRNGKADASKDVVGKYRGYLRNSYSDVSKIPWNSNMRNIINVSFAIKTKPNSMAYWFRGAFNMINCDMTNLNIDNVTNMGDTYAYCNNLTGEPVCGKNVTDMSSTYYSCRNLTGSPVCGEKVINMAWTYGSCGGLTGIPVCGNNVTNMRSTYYFCFNLTGSPVCGEKVTDMSNTYYECSNLTGNPVCGNNVTNMCETYSNCCNLIGSPVCGDKVANLERAYENCANLTGSPACGPNVTSMCMTYYNCYNLTGEPVCGEKVTDMRATYYNCTNLIGVPVCGDNVVSMCSISNYVVNKIGTYQNCTNLTGSPACGPNVINMCNAYYNCTNISGPPACGPKVTNMTNTYYNCVSLSDSPVCGESVVNMVNTYYNCISLSGSPVCGENVINMRDTYNGCVNLTGSPVCGPNVTDMSHAYYNCKSLTGPPACGPNVTNIGWAYWGCKNISGNAYFYSTKLNSVANCFWLRDSSNRLNIFATNGTTTMNTLLYTNTNSLVGDYITWTDEVATNGYYCNTYYNIYIYPFDVVGGEITSPATPCLAYNTSTTVSTTYKAMDSNPVISVTSSNESIATVSNVTYGGGNISFDVTASNTDGTVPVEIKMEQSDIINETTTITFNVIVNETGEYPTGYTVEAIDGATYGFELNSDGYYESKNKGVNSSYAICKVNLKCDGLSNVYLDCINSGEKNFDFGILSNIDSTLTLSDSADSSNVFKSFKGASSTSIQTVDYGVVSQGEHFIYVKYRKDSSSASGNDTLQFKVRFE